MGFPNVEAFQVKMICIGLLRLNTMNIVLMTGISLYRTLVQLRFRPEHLHWRRTNRLEQVDSSVDLT